MFHLGMDVSTLEETERLGGKFYQNGKPRELLDILRENNIDSIRLRLWVQPYNERGEGYGAGGCDIETVTRLIKRAKAAGMSVLLDFHYSDFWVDPARQCVPRSWKGLEFEGLVSKVYEYTARTLGGLAEKNASPELVQVGNEITGGMLWPYGQLKYNELTRQREGYEALGELVDAGCRAVRSVSDAQTVLHLERSGDNEVYREWFDAMRFYGVDYDVIGMSYYPFWHGSFSMLKANMDDMAARYEKDVMVVETSYAFTGKHYDPAADGVNLVINESLKMADGGEPPYPLSPEGQRAFVAQLLNLVKSVAGGRGRGVYYWEPAWLPLPGSTWATEAAREYINETHKKGGNEWANQCLFDYGGNALPALGEFKRFERP